MEIRCKCVDATDRPKEIPSEKWVKKGGEYNITWVYWKPIQNLMAVELAEFDISDCFPYNSYKIQRFMIHKDDIELFKELAKSCSEIGEMDLSKVLETVEIEN